VNHEPTRSELYFVETISVRRCTLNVRRVLLRPTIGNRWNRTGIRWHDYCIYNVGIAANRTCDTIRSLQACKLEERRMI
tara:strand:+ start:14649 stop:14885 length:237 start_codon:yes stop_codon:yes gene_type:complete